MKPISRIVLALVALLAIVGASRAQVRAEEATSTPSPKESTVECAVLNTNMGNITVRFFPDAAPKAVENFLGLARKGYYDGVIFHRVIEGFMIQGGDPTGSGYGGKSFWGEPFEDEFSGDRRFDKKGILAMANAGPKTNGSQFFITLAATPWLNDAHTIFGEVIDGLDVVDQIGQLETDPTDKPLREVSIESVSLGDCDGK